MDEATNELRILRIGLLPLVYFSIKFILSLYFYGLEYCMKELHFGDNYYSINSHKRR